MKKLFLQSGKLMVGDFPEEPIPYGVGDEQYYGARMDEYNAAVSAAKDSAVEVVNPELFQTGMLPNEYHPIPEGWTVEIEDQFNQNDRWFDFKDNPVSLIDAQQLADEGRTRKIARLVKNIEKEGVILEEPQYVDFNKPNIFIDGDFNDSYEARVRRSTGKGKNKIPLKEPENLIASQIPYPDQSGFATEEEYFEACRKKRYATSDIAAGVPEYVELEKPDHTMKCNVCGEVFDRSNLTSVILHEHDGKEETAAQALGIKGKKVEAVVPEHREQETDFKTVFQNSKLFKKKEAGIPDVETDIPHPHHSAPTIAVFKAAGIPESGETGKPIPILDAKRIAENYNYNQVVIIARKVGENGIEHVTTYGTDKSNCDVAAHIGDFLRYEIMKWEKKSVSPPPQAVSRWISVQDEWPLETMPVLWCHDPVEEPYIVASLLDEGFDENQYTHWMPLPEPPITRKAKP